MPIIAKMAATDFYSKPDSFSRYLLLRGPSSFVTWESSTFSGGLSHIVDGDKRKTQQDVLSLNPFIFYTL